MRGADHRCERRSDRRPPNHHLKITIRERSNGRDTSADSADASHVVARERRGTEELLRERVIQTSLIERLASCLCK